MSASFSTYDASGNARVDRHDERLKPKMGAVQIARSPARSVRLRSGIGVVPAAQAFALM
jgi:hypothetical protein